MKHEILNECKDFHGRRKQNGTGLLVDKQPIIVYSSAASKENS